MAGVVKHPIRAALMLSTMLAPVVAWGQGAPRYTIPNTTYLAFFGNALSVKSFGAQGNELSYNDGTMPGGGCILNSNDVTAKGPGFTTLDVGLPINVTTDTTSLNGSIISVIDSNDVSLSVCATDPIPTYSVFQAGIVSPGTGYDAGDIISISLPGQTVAPTFTVLNSQVVAASIASAGSGIDCAQGGADNADGTLTVYGTSGTPIKRKSFNFAYYNVTATNGSISAINSISNGGSYAINPNTGSTSDPVSGCGGDLVGASFYLSTGLRKILISSQGSTPTSFPNQSNYAVTAVTGSGSGGTLSGLGKQTMGGNFKFGANDQPAFAAAYAAANALKAQGQSALVFVPVGHYFLASGTNPLLLSEGVKCAGEGASIIDMGVGYTGAAIGFDGINQGSTRPFSGNSGAISEGTVAYEVADCSILGDRTAPGGQIGVAGYDALQHANFEHLHMEFIPGPCIQGGAGIVAAGQHVSYMGETHMTDIYCMNSGTANLAELDFNSITTSSRASYGDITLDDVRAFQPYGPGVRFCAATNGQINNIIVEGMHIEGAVDIAPPGGAPSGDLFQIGCTGTGDQGYASVMTLHNLILNDPPINAWALDLVNTGTGNHFIVDADFATSGGDPYGGGLNVGDCLSCSFRTPSLVTLGVDTQIASTATVNNLALTYPQNLSALALDIDPTIQPLIQWNGWVLNPSLSAITQAANSTEQSTFTPTVVPQNLGNWQTNMISSAGFLWGNGCFDFTETFAPTFAGSGPTHPYGVLEFGLPIAASINSERVFAVQGLSAITWPNGGTQALFRPQPNQPYGTIVFGASGAALPSPALAVSNLSSGSTYTVAVGGCFN